MTILLLGSTATTRTRASAEVASLAASRLNSARSRHYIPAAPTNVLMITDGVPGSCELLDDAIAAAQEVYPAIATYFVVVGSDPKPFHALAAAGGTDEAVGVTAGDPAATEASMFEALAFIQSRARKR